ncbi:MAG: 16S rRNA (adenine(1518)-N(6)/adenine(1519)-N(6))-dimethyltransferase RsmA [Candidatus Spechtbacterales bacterium]
MSSLDIQQLLQKYNISPNKVLGQNFLIDKNVVRSFVEASNISKDDIVVEVGPGTGTITGELAKKAGEVIAVEKDPGMVDILKNELSSFSNVVILQEDVLKFKIENLELFRNSKFEIQNSNYKVVGAIPYYLTGRLFRHFLENTQVRPVYISVIIQKEVAEKIIAKPPRSNMLAISVQLYGEPKIIKKVSKNSFWPQPKVDSSILIVENIKKPDIDEKLFFKILHAGFSSPRKQLHVNLSSSLGVPKERTGEWLKNSNIDPAQRAQTLSVKEWVNIAKTFQDYS